AAYTRRWISAASRCGSISTSMRARWPCRSRSATQARSDRWTLILEACRAPVLQDRRPRTRLHADRADQDAGVEVDGRVAAGLAVAAVGVGVARPADAELEQAHDAGRAAEARLAGRVAGRH